MRLRSSQLVFLLLLACSVQVREEQAMRWMADAVSGRTTASAQLRETASPSAEHHRQLSLQIARAAQPIRLDPASRAAHRTPWTMRRPALASAAIASYTSFLRA